VGDLNARVWKKYQPQFALMRAAASRKDEGAE
jgi:hypothetical protein